MPQKGPEHSLNIEYQEVNLPFNHVEEDHIQGEELHNALFSRDLGENLGDYSISSEFNGDQYVFEASKDSYMTNKTSSIKAEIEPDRDYSHLRMELSSSTDRGLRELKRDLEEVESGLEDHFVQSAISSYNHKTRFGYTD